MRPATMALVFPCQVADVGLNYFASFPGNALAPITVQQLLKNATVMITPKWNESVQII